MDGRPAGSWALHTRASLATIRGWLRDPGGVVTIFLGLYAAAFGGWTIFDWGGERLRTFIGDAAFLPINLTAAVLAWRASRRQDVDTRTRVAWRLVSVAFAALWLGDLLWFSYEVVLGTEPFPSWADAGYVAYYPILFAALLTFPVVRRTAGEHVKLTLDSLTVLLGGGMIIWYFVLRPTALAGGSGSLETALSLAYPAGDLVLLLGIATVLLRRPDGPSRRPLMVLALGVALFVVADVGYGSLALGDAYGAGDWPDALWMVAQYLMVFSAHDQWWRSKHRRPEDDEPLTARPFSVLPYVSIAVGYALLLFVARPEVSTPLGGLVLGAGVLTALVIMRQMSVLQENARLLAEVKRIASTDPLTGMMSRRHFLEQADREFHRAARHGRPVSAIALDVDYFKQVNDSYGHAAGDEVLKAVGRWSLGCLRKTDIVGRMGGDEIVILLPDTPLPAAAAAAERLRDRSGEPVSCEGGPVRVTLSIGVADAGACSSLGELIARADAALYDAKRAGRDCVRSASTA